MTVLIVDDQPVNLRLLQAVLEAEQYSVVQASDGLAALEVLHARPVQAIISDILMPRMDGYRLCAEVRRHESLRAIPFIFYTATYTSPADEKLCYDLGADRYLRKPAGPAEIVAALQSAMLSTRRSAGPPPAVAVDSVIKQYSEQLVLKLEEKNAELALVVEKLRANEERLAALLRSMDDMLEGIQLIDADWRYVYVNRAAAVQGQTTSEQLLGRTMMECYPGIENTELFARMEAVMSGRVPVQMRNRFEFPDGSHAWFELSIEPDPHGIMIRSVDITDRERSESMLRARAEELERFHRLSIGREQRMIELKREVNALAVALGRDPPYASVREPTAAAGDAP